MRCAEELFAANGFAQTSTEEIAEAARVARTTLYRCFMRKTDLFRAVFMCAQAKLAVRMIRAAASVRGDPWKAFEASCVAYIEGGSDAGLQQIAFLDGPRVLGWNVVHAIEALYALALIREKLELLIRAGRVAPQPVDPLSRSVLSALFELGNGIARSKTRPATLLEARAGLSRLLEVLSN